MTDPLVQIDALLREGGWDGGDVVAGVHGLIGYAETQRLEVERLRGLLNEAHLARIAAENPGIDIERVRTERGW